MSFVLCYFLIYSIEAQQNISGLTPEKKLDQFLIEQWTSLDGLPTNSLSSAMFSDRGFLWIAGYNGVVRFDGYEFKVFDKSNTPALNTNAIYSAFQDEQHRIWICTNGSGVLRLEKGEFIKPFDDENLPKSVVKGLSDGEVIWLGSVNEGLYKYENGEITAVNFPDVMNVTILDIKRDNEGAIWVCTDGKGVTRIYKGIFTSYREVVGGGNDRFQSLHIDRMGRTWVGSFEGLFYIEEGKMISVDELDGSLINSIAEDIYGNLWVTTNNGIVRRNANTHEFEFLDENTGLPGTEFTHVVLDESNNLWFTSSRDGLFRISSGSFLNFTEAQGLSTNKINSLLEMSDKSILVGAENGKIFRIDSGVVSEFDIKFKFPKTRIRDLFIDSKEVLWVSTYFGLLRKEGNSEKLYTTLDGLPTNQIRSVREGSNGDLIIATRNSGIIKWDQKDSFEIFDIEKGLKSNFITALAIHEKGTIITGSNGGGLSLIDPSGVITTYGVEDGIPHGVIFKIHIDGEDIWIATNTGICVLKDSKIYAKTTREGLPTDSFFDIIEAEDGLFWLPSASGIYSIHKKDLLAFMLNENENISFDVYTENDGLINRECIGATQSMATSDGSLWFPTLGGLAMLNPDELRISSIVPQVYIDKFLINEKELDIDENIVMGSTKGRYVFEFSAPEFISPTKTKFKYILEPYDSAWTVLSGRERKIEYTNIPYGKYVFKVMTNNGKGEWNKESANINFEVLPYWYETVWAKVSVTVLFLAFLYLIYLWRLIIDKREKEKLELVIKERTTKIELQKEEIKEQRDSLGESFDQLKKAEDIINHQNNQLKGNNNELEKIVAQRTADLKLVVNQLISANNELDQFVYRSAHDLRGPVSRLMGICNLVKADKEFIKDPLFIENLEATAYEMDNLIKRLIALNTVKNKEVEKETIDLKQLVEEVIKLMITGDKDFKIKADVDPFAYESDALLIRVLITNAISNAIRYLDTSKEKHWINVKVKLLSSKNDFEIVIEDNGIGVDELIKKSAFQMFFKGVNHSQGFGLGLYEVDNIVKRLGGKVCLDCDGGITTFRAVLPLIMPEGYDNIAEKLF